MTGLRGTVAAQPSGEHERRGYALGDGNLNGRGLLSHASFGYELVVRLKDSRPILREEIGFWAGRLAELVRACEAGAETAAELVTHAPSSGKVPDDEHLATMLAHLVAAELGLPCQACFRPTLQRGHKGSRVTKLNELHNAPFVWVGPAGVRRVFVVDDVVFTRSTATRCAAAAAGAGVMCWFAVLYRA